jgi:[ribosomal protein S5]-alanine N-acetyltransferase
VSEAPILPERLESERLRLILLTAADVTDMRAGRRQDRWHPGYPRRDDVDATALFQDGDTWGPRHVVHEAQAVGSIGFFGPPTPAEDGVLETEVGYGLVEDARGIGLATEALTLLCSAVDPLCVRLRASVDPANSSSLRVVAKCGFTQVRGTNEDGELVLVRPVASGR